MHPGKHNAKETLSDLIKIGVVIKGLENGCFLDHLLVNTAGTTEWTKFVKEIQHVELEEKYAACSDGFVGDGPRNLFMVWNLPPHGERLSTENMQNNQTSGWSGTDDKTKGKPSKGRANKLKPTAKAKARARERVNNTARKGRKDFTKWRSTKTSKKHKPVKTTQSGRTRVGITPTGLTQTGGRAIGAQICGLILHGNKRQDNCHRRSRPKNSPTQHGRSISMLGGLTMCEFSVDGGEQENEQGEVDRNRCDDWNDRAEMWVQNEVTNGHKIENWAQNIENWVQNELTDGHKKLEQQNLAHKLIPEQDDGLSRNLEQKLE